MFIRHYWICFSVATFARNKLYLEYIRTAQGNVARAMVILVGFLFWTPHVWVVGIGGLVSGIIILIYDVKYTKSYSLKLRLKEAIFVFLMYSY